MDRLARSAITKQSLGRAHHGQARAQCYNEADGRARLRARSVITKQASGCANHGQACVQCYNQAVEQVCLPLVRLPCPVLQPPELLGSTHADDVF